VDGCDAGMSPRHRAQRPLLARDRTARIALNSAEKAVISPNAMMVLYRLIRRVEWVAIEPLLFGKGAIFDGTWG